MAEKTHLLQDLYDNLKKQELAANSNDPQIKAAAEAAAKGLGLTSTVAAATDAFWAGTTATSSYLGKFAARGNTQASIVSWANVQPDDEIATSQVNTLDLAKTLDLARDFDGDIDGLASTGNSIIKEGEERFVFGASYIGTRGVSITETAGLLGSFVHGKRVNWTDGDIWVRQKGGKMYRTDIDTEFFDYHAHAKEKISVFRNAGENIELTTRAGADILVQNVAKRDFITHLQAACQTTKTFTKASTQLTCTAAATSVTTAAFQTTVSTTGLSMAVAMSGALLAYNAASARIVVDSTLLTAQISQNNFFNVARNSVEAYATSLEKFVVGVSHADLRTASTGTQLVSTLFSVVKNNSAVTKSIAKIVDSDVVSVKSGINFSKSMCEDSDVSIKMNRHQMSINKSSLSVFV